MALKIDCGNKKQYIAVSGKTVNNKSIGSKGNKETVFNVHLQGSSVWTLRSFLTYSKYPNVYNKLNSNKKIIPYRCVGVDIHLQGIDDKCRRSCRCWRTKCSGTWSGAWRTTNSQGAPDENRVCRTCTTSPLWCPRGDSYSTPCWRWRHTLQYSLRTSTGNIEFTF